MAIPGFQVIVRESGRSSKPQLLQWITGCPLFAGMTSGVIARDMDVLRGSVFPRGTSRAVDSGCHIPGGMSAYFLAPRGAYQEVSGQSAKTAH
jgi:hypothetical protein